MQKSNPENLRFVTVRNVIDDMTVSAMSKRNTMFVFYRREIEFIPIKHVISSYVFVIMLQRK